MIILKNIIGMLTDPKNTRMFLLGGIVVLCFLLLRQCEATEEAKGEANNATILAAKKRWAALHF